MTKKEAVSEFKEYILPAIKAEYEQDGRRDIPARREAWNNFTDYLRTDRRITESQYMTWISPACCD